MVKEKGKSYLSSFCQKLGVLAVDPKALEAQTSALKTHIIA